MSLPTSVVSFSHLLAAKVLKHFMIHLYRHLMMYFALCNYLKPVVTTGLILLKTFNQKQETREPEVLKC